MITGEEEAEVELRSPEADKALRQKYKEEVVEVSPDDSVSQVGLARRTTVKKEYKPSGLRERLRDAVGGHSSSSDKERDAKEKDRDSKEKDKNSSRRHRDDLDIPDRKSSSRSDKKDSKATSEVGASSQVSHRSSRSHHRTSTRSEAGGGSPSRSKLDREREKDSKDRERKSASRVGTSSSKEVNLDDDDSGKKKSNMIKSLFKKMKDKEDEKIATATKEKEREERRDRERERERRTSKEGHGERHVRRAASVAN